MTTLSNPESTVNDKHTQTADNNTDTCLSWVRIPSCGSALVTGAPHSSHCLLVFCRLPSVTSAGL